MKKIFQYSILAAGMMLGMTSCEDMFGDFLDKEPSNELTEEQVYSSWTTATQSHYDTYNFLRHGAHRINRSWLDAASDLAATSFATGGVRTTFNIGNYYGAGGASELTDSWEHYYRGIRKCNQTITKLPTVPKSADLSETQYESQKTWFVAEARFLRAYFYWELFLRFGPVPVVTDVLEPNNQEQLLSYATRPTVKEFSDFIISELNYCTDHLLAKEEAIGEFVGHASRPMASALLSRVSLFLASPRYADASGMSWEKALEYNSQFMEKYSPLYSLMQMDAQSTTPEAALTTVWLNTDYGGNNTEVIFYRNDATVNWGAIRDDVNVGEGGDGGCCPSQNLIDMYDMIDGSAPFAQYDVTGAPVYNGVTPSVNAASGYSDAHMWEDRDARLNASVLHHNNVWGNGVIDVRLGMRDNPVGNANATPTGYYLRKYVPESILDNNHTGSSYRVWTIIRYAEMLLNRAEILNEINFAANKNEICALLDEVRFRAGIHNSVATRADLNDQTAMRNFIHKERTVEFAFEEHRWWDVRRWNCAKEALGRDIIGIDVAMDGTITRKVAQKRVFEDRMYLYPIPESEYWKTSLENNAGW